MASGKKGASKIQSIERAASLLRLVAAHSPAGTRLTDIARAAELTKGTSHRILAALVAEALVDQDADSGLYFPGLALVALGNAAGERFGLARTALPAMRRLAEKTGDTIYFSVRSGNEAICLQRVEGGFPIKTLTLNVGDRRPLGVGAGSLALLAYLPDPEVDTIVSANSSALPRFGERSTGDLHAMVQEARRLGYAYNNERLIAGMSAVGVPVRNANGEPVAALSVAAISARMQADRRAVIVPWLEHEARALEVALGPVLSNPTALRGRRAAAHAMSLSA